MNFEKESTIYLKIQIISNLKNLKVNTGKNFITKIHLTQK